MQRIATWFSQILRICIQLYQHGLLLKITLFTKKVNCPLFVPYSVLYQHSLTMKFILRAFQFVPYFFGAYFTFFN